MMELNNEPVSATAWEVLVTPHVEATGEYDEMLALMDMLTLKTVGCCLFLPLTGLVELSERPRPASASP
jgi:hypothetical protein